MTTIGHKLREAIKRFAGELIEQYGPSDAPDDPDKTMDRLRAVIKTRSSVLGETRSAAFDAMIGYWGPTIDLAHRLEHGDEKALT